MPLENKTAPKFQEAALNNVKNRKFQNTSLILEAIMPQSGRGSLHQQDSGRTREISQKKNKTMQYNNSFLNQSGQPHKKSKSRKRDDMIMDQKIDKIMQMKSKSKMAPVVASAQRQCPPLNEKYFQTNT